MKALSIRQPWVHAILHFGKRIENRDWRAAPRSMLGKVFLIHAAKGCTVDEHNDAADFMRDVYAARPWEGSTTLPAINKLPRGALVARARLVDFVYPGGSCDSPWYTGALGLVLDDVETLPAPIPFKGALGFFDVPAGAVP